MSSAHHGLDERFAVWRALPFTTHLAGVLGLLVMLVAVHSGDALFSGTLTDELAYLKGARRSAAGESPFGDGSGYLYTAAFSMLCARLAEAIGEVGMLFTIRYANLVGLATTLWITTAWLRRPFWVRFAAAGVVALASPIVREGMGFGNLSFLVSGLVLAGFVVADRSILAGALFGLSTAVKPIAPPFVACLALRRAGREPRPIGTAVIAAGITLVLYFGFPFWRDLLEMARHAPLARTVSPHRFGVLLGLDLHPLFLSLGALALGVVVARKRSYGPTAQLAIATATAIAFTPVVWWHTLLLTFPLQAAALSAAIETRTLRYGHYRLIGVALAIATIQLSRGASGIDDQPILGQLVAVGLPALAPAGLATVVLWSERVHPAAPEVSAPKVSASS